jgi:methyltransferase (TIGR00027 family)
MALFRALETVRRPAAARLFDDPLAARFLRPSLRAVVHAARLPGLGPRIPAWIDRRWPGARPAGVARTRFLDDLLRAALREGVDQVVLLGAGFDARAVRLAGIERARVFEVDRAATQAAKQERVRRALGALPPHVTFVALDFERQELGSALRRAGFDPTRPACLLWEGVTNYLTAEAVDATLRSVACVAAPGSRFAFTYVDSAILSPHHRSAGNARLATTLQRAGEPWTFGLDPAGLPAYLAARGFDLLQDIGTRELRARLLGPSGPHLEGYEFYRVAEARVRGTRDEAR